VREYLEVKIAVLTAQQVVHNPQVENEDLDKLKI
jgi:hypothetical protein